MIFKKGKNFEFSKNRNIGEKDLSGVYLYKISSRYLKKCPSFGDAGQSPIANAVCLPLRLEFSQKGNSVQSADDAIASKWALKLTFFFKKMGFSGIRCWRRLKILYKRHFTCLYDFTLQ